MTTKATRDVIDGGATRPYTDFHITGGAIDGTPVGATTPSTGKFTNLTATSTITVQANGTLDLSASNITVLGTIHAYYAADLAEAYIADKPYEPGTVVEIGGEKEITIATRKGRVFGVISTNPFAVMNSGAPDGLPVAMIGRTPVRVIGKVMKGQQLVLSDIPGVAMAVHSADDSVVIGRSLVTSGAEEERLIEAVVRASI